MPQMLRTPGWGPANGYSRFALHLSGKSDPIASYARFVSCAPINHGLWQKQFKSKRPVFFTWHNSSVPSMRTQAEKRLSRRRNCPFWMVRSAFFFLHFRQHLYYSPKFVPLLYTPCPALKAIDRNRNVKLPEELWSFLCWHYLQAVSSQVLSQAEMSLTTVFGMGRPDGPTSLESAPTLCLSGFNRKTS